VSEVRRAGGIALVIPALFAFTGQEASALHRPSLQVTIDALAAELRDVASPCEAAAASARCSHAMINACNTLSALTTRMEIGSDALQYEPFTYYVRRYVFRAYQVYAGDCFGDVTPDDEGSECHASATELTTAVTALPDRVRRLPPQAP
jgi:hypothetical protein